MKEKRNGKIIGYVIIMEYNNQKIKEKEVNSEVFSTEVTKLKPFR